MPLEGIEGLFEGAEHRHSRIDIITSFALQLCDERLLLRDVPLDLRDVAIGLGLDATFAFRIGHRATSHCPILLRLALQLMHQLPRREAVEILGSRVGSRADDQCFSGV
jgi:hypothetical protein